MLRTAEAHSADRRGMSLVELIVAIAIFMAIMSGVILMFTSVTNTVRRSYRTMDLYEQTRGALLALERDVQTVFATPASGAEVQFYGEPYGFVFVGIDQNQRLSRLTYAIHRDTSRMTNPGDRDARGERVTLPKTWQEMQSICPNLDLNAVYSNGGDLNSLVDFEVEVVYGVLLRYYEENVENVERFPLLSDFVQAASNAPRLPRPEFFSDETGRGSVDNFPWFSNYLWEKNEGDTTVSDATVPAYVRDVLGKVETCHYWIQLLNGPGLPTIVPWSLTDIWWRERTLYVPVADQFWYDPVVPVPPFPDGQRRYIRDHIVAENFVLNAYLLDPGTGERLRDTNGLFVEVLGPSMEPIFKYAVEEKANRSPIFNTLYNLNHTVPDSGGTGTINAFESVVAAVSANPANPDIEYAVSKMTEARQFYDLGNPLQMRLPAAFDITLWVLNEPVVSGGAPDLYRFSQTINLPAGFLRRSRAVR